MALKPWSRKPAGLVEGPETIAGFIAEPVTGASGACLTASDDYWRTVTEICRRHDILLVADEVMTGFGRLGSTWGHQQFPFEPDVVVGGKGLGGGYVPIGMVATRDDVAAVLARAGFMFFTFSGNDGACAGADMVLQILERESLVERAAATGARLHQRLHEEFDDHPHVAEVRGRGMFAGIELVADRDTGRRFAPDARANYQVVGETLARDVAVYPAGSGPVQDAIMLGPPFTLGDDELETIVGVVHEAIDAVGSRLAGRSTSDAAGVR